MKKEIVIIAAINSEENLEQYRLRGENYVLSGEGHWHCTASNQCLAVIKALKEKSDKFLVKVLATAPSGKFKSFQCMVFEVSIVN